MLTSIECDLLVVGSGAGGLSTAVTAAWHGLNVIVAEKEEFFGGTTAWSGGWMWAQLNPLAQRAGIVEDPQAPRAYLREALGNNFNEARVSAFLNAAPRMVSFFETHTALQFEAGLKIPDTYGKLSGAGTGGRSVIAAPYDARELGDLVKRLRLPMRETTFMGLTIQAGADLSAFMNVTRSPGAFVHVARRFGRHLAALALHGRGMQLRNGIALVARLLRSARDLGVDLRTSSPATRPLVHGMCTRFEALPWRLTIRYAVFASGFVGKSKSKTTRRDPHRGHFKRPSSIETGNAPPLVQISVSRSSRMPALHSRIDFMPSRLPQAQRAVMRSPASRASGRVSIDIFGNKNEKRTSARAIKRERDCDDVDSV
jgi:glycine/D-amino acid oxidase-like deaminating enzyme